MNGPLVFRKDLLASEHDEGNGRKSIVLKNPVTDQFFYMSLREYTLLKELDGKLNLDQALQVLRDRGHYYSIEEAAKIIEVASHLGLLLGSPLSRAAVQLSLMKKLDARRRVKHMMSLLSLYIPLGNPDRFLDRTLFLVAFAFNRRATWVWAAIGVSSLYLVLGNLDRIVNEHLALLSTRDLLIILPVAIVTRLAHELGHAYAAKAYGLEVKTFGIALLILFPCPYIDTTDAWKLSRRRQRMVIGAAGIMAEMIVACLCVFVWFFTKPGWLNTLSFYVVTVSTVSTIAFNANPLMRFDGYFILSDYLRLPNLAPRSIQYVKSLVMAIFFGGSRFPIPQVAPRNAVIFAVYGVSSICYRITLYGAITAALYYRFDKVLGLALAAYALAMFVARPVFRGVVELRKNHVLASWDGKAWRRAALTAGLTVTAFLWPWSHTDTFPCRVDSQEARAISIPVNAIVTNVFIREGARLVKGQKMFELDTTVLQFELRKAWFEKEIVELQMKSLTLDKGDFAKVPQKALELAAIDDAIARMESDLRKSLEATKAPFDGVVSRLDRRLKPGFQAAEATVVGQIKSISSLVAVASLPDRLLGKIRQGQEVQVRLPWKEGRVVASTMSLATPLPASLAQHGQHGKAANDGPWKGGVRKDLQSPAGESESEYVWSAELPAGEDIPLGMTGWMSVAFPRESVVSRVYGYIVRTANRESFF
ncbi:MAG: site-2 protease family protein [Desulfomonilaceae bacterium]